MTLNNQQFIFMKTKIIQIVHIGKYPYSVTMVMGVRGSKPMFGPLSGLTVKYGASGTKPGHVIRCRGARQDSFTII